LKYDLVISAQKISSLDNELIVGYGVYHTAIEHALDSKCLQIKIILDSGHNNQALKSEYVQGVITKKTEFFDDNRVRGQPASICLYQDGLPHGVMLVFKKWSKGQIVTKEIPYEKGEIHGEVKAYDIVGEKRTLIECTTYVQGKKQGLSKLYHPTGKLKADRVYANDVLTREVRFSASGKPQGEVLCRGHGNVADDHRRGVDEIG